MKQVSFEVAKAIKEAGYPQGLEDTAYYNENGVLVKPCVFDGGKEIADAPTYLEVWLWLWREKEIAIHVDYSFYGMSDKNDPEEVVINVINRLVEPNIIKQIKK